MKRYNDAIPSVFKKAKGIPLMRRKKKKKTYTLFNLNNKRMPRYADLKIDKETKRKCRICLKCEGIIPIKTNLEESVSQSITVSAAVFNSFNFDVSFK